MRESSVALQDEKICMFVPSADGGHPRYATELLTALVHAGQRGMELVSSEDLLEEFSSDLYPVHRILPPLRPRSQFSSSAHWAFSRLTYYPRQQRRFLRWLANRPDISVVHLQEWTPWLATSFVSSMRAMGKRVYYTVHNVVPHRYPPGVSPAVMHRWLRSACRLCNGLFVHTQKLSEQLADFLEHRHPPIHVVPHGVWTTDQIINPPSVEQRLQWKRLLFFGTIRRNKGLDLLLRAMEHLPDYSLTIAGEPLEGAYYREEVLPLVDRLRRAGIKIDLRDTYVPDKEMAELFATHSALMLPYTPAFAAQSGVVFMAITHEIPVIASEVGGLRELLQEHPIGVTFPQVTPEQIAEGVHRLHTQSQHLDIAGHIRAAKQRYSWQSAAAATLAGYACTGEADTRIFHDRPIQTTSAA